MTDWSEFDLDGYELLADSDSPEYDYFDAARMIDDYEVAHCEHRWVVDGDNTCYCGDCGVEYGRHQ